MSESSPSVPRFVTYRWLAQFYLSPPTVSDLERYRRVEGQQFLGASKQIPALASLVETIESWVNTDADLHYAQQHFAKSYSMAFDVAGPRSALPYASIYRSERALLYQKPTQDMNRLLDLLQTALPPNLNEPADHLGIQLQIAAELNERELTHASVPISSAEFIATHLLPWLPAFVKQCEKLMEPEPVLTLAKTSLALAQADASEAQSSE